MNRISREMRGDARKRPAELEREIDVVRTDLEVTLEALGHKLAPQQLVSKAFSRARRDGGVFAQNLSEDIKENPLPAVLASIGIAWLFATNARHSERNGLERDAEAARHDGHDGLKRTAGRARHSLQQSKENLRDGIESSRDAVSHTAAKLSRTAASMHAGAREGWDSGAAALRSASSDADAAMSATRRGVQHARARARHWVTEQPLLLGAIGVVAGALIGAVLPPTEEEDETIGPLRDKVVRRTEASGTEALRRAREHAEGIVERETESSTSDGQPWHGSDGAPPGGQQRPESRH